ncbi:STAS domain-containing protein [Streptomyces sp. NPDC058257]|uniref:STAS domain-containing protein n=1 Tax=Streptomyces sp. NPDC058257 TaxID=3346409 RepID=UPI0036E37E69
MAGLEELDAALRELGVDLVFAELKDTVRRKVERYGLARTFDARRFYPTVEAAVDAFRSDSGTDWGPGAPGDR